MSDRKCFTVVFHLEIDAEESDALFGPSPPEGLSEDAAKRWAIMNGFFPPILTRILGAMKELGLTQFCLDGFGVAAGRLDLKGDAHYALVAAAEAALRYDDAIYLCAGDPERISEFCTAQGDDLDVLYFDWQTKAVAALAAEGLVKIEEENDATG